MVDEVTKEVTTGVDDLIELLKGTDRISVDEASKKLKIPMEVLQSWVDFLVEEKILGVEYKFTRPFIYLNKEKEESKVQKKVDEHLSYDTFKKEFSKKALGNNIPEPQINELWKHHLTEKLENAKDFFFREARKRGITKTEELWKTYQQAVVE